MSAAEMRELAASLLKKADEQSLVEFESTMNSLSDKLPRIGKSKRDAVYGLFKLMGQAERRETLAALELGESNEAPRSARVRNDLDSTGLPPELGVTYCLPSGETWTRVRTAGASKKIFADHAKSTTWQAMRAA